MARAYVAEPRVAGSSDSLHRFVRRLVSWVFRFTTYVIREIEVRHEALRLSILLSCILQLANDFYYWKRHLRLVHAGCVVFLVTKPSRGFPSFN